ncbi:MAG: hypothetical protein P1P74_00990 [Desulfuromonadales bacterium]|nr:hypothetical protein [Desulfuromonadales bacterium]MDT8422475.1 hypothetical protein [Desulfuromonadales bacterium]
MNNFDDDLGMVPYPLIFPEAEEKMLGISLPRKVGKLKAGEYHFIEAYCVEEGCDCRRTSIFVVNAKGKMVATIDFGFDPDHPLSGPFLNEYQKQLAGAEELLEIFVDEINNNPDWLKRMYKQYKQVRKEVDGKTYRGKAFPKPGLVPRSHKLPPADEDLCADFKQLLEAAVKSPPISNKHLKRSKGALGQLLTEPRPVAKNMTEWVEFFLQNQQDSFSGHDFRKTELQRFLLAYDRAEDELAQLIVELYMRKDEARLDEALTVLTDVCDILRTDLERRRPDAMRRIENWQAALARHVYAESVDMELGAMVTQVLLDTRIEILPLLHQANSQRMLAKLDHDPEFAADPEQGMRELLSALEELESGSPFELFDAVLQMMLVGDSDVQVILCRHMLEVEHPVIREMAALMLFHPVAEVRSGVARQLAEVEGRFLTPETLRRLIVARNWFPEELRKQIDQTVTNARRARVECAPLPPRRGTVVYASGVDGAMAQTFQVMIPEGKGFLCCAIMPKRGAGVADAFFIHLANKRERNNFVEMLKAETGAHESTSDYLDRRICQALADGAEHGKVPSHWLAAIAEQLGCDQWKAAPLDVMAELKSLRNALESCGARYVTERYREQAFIASASWLLQQTFAYSWFEDDVDVDKIVQKTQGRKRQIDPERCIDTILHKILQPRRKQWLERLVLTTRWLKSIKKPPVPWEQMFLVTEALADETVAIEDIPLMDVIAAESFAAYLGRREEGR